MSTTHHPLSWPLRAIARLERVGDVRPPRLTEPGHEKWHRMRRKLGWKDLVALLFEDLADAFPHPFDLASWAEDPLAELPEDEAEALALAAAETDDADTLTFLRQAARSLGLQGGGEIADLPRAQPGQPVLELPGSGGRIAAYQALQHDDLSLHDPFVFVADTDAERLLVGLAAVELRANPPRVLTSDQLRQTLADGETFARVLGVRGDERGAALAEELGLEVRWA